jgi:hypothetical protein
MDNIVTPSAVDTGTAPAPSFATPPTPVAPATAPAMPNVQAQPVMADGGNVSSESGVKNFFKGVNWTEVIFGALGVGALVYLIYYYRFKIQQDKLINNELQRQIDELKMNMQSKMKGNYKNM